MKLFIAVISLVLPGFLATAASQQEESRFLTAVQIAYTTTNIPAITALHCWDGLTSERRAAQISTFKENLRRERKVQSVEYTARELTGSITNSGVVFLPNLTPVKWIKIQFEPDVTSGVTSRRSLELEVGEKQGKLMLISYIPSKL